MYTVPYYKWHEGTETERAVVLAQVVVALWMAQGAVAAPSTEPSVTTER